MTLTMTMTMMMVVMMMMMAIKVTPMMTVKQAFLRPSPSQTSTTATSFITIFAPSPWLTMTV
eukprot:2215714-Karenia_brevis.AAC.1